MNNTAQLLLLAMLVLELLAMLLLGAWTAFGHAGPSAVWSPIRNFWPFGIVILTAVLTLIGAVVAWVQAQWRPPGENSSDLASIAQIPAQQHKLGNHLNSVQSIVQNLSRELLARFSAVEAQSQEVRKELRGIGAESRQLTAENATLRESLTSVQAAKSQAEALAQQARQRAEDANREIDDLQAEVHRLKDSTDDAGRSLAVANSQLQQVRGELAALHAGLVRADPGAVNEARESSTKLSKVEESAQNLAAALVALWKVPASNGRSLAVQARAVDGPVAAALDRASQNQLRNRVRALNTLAKDGWSGDPDLQNEMIGNQGGLISASDIEQGVKSLLLRALRQWIPLFRAFAWSQVVDHWAELSGSAELTKLRLEVVRRDEELRTALLSYDVIPLPIHLLQPVPAGAQRYVDYARFDDDVSKRFPFLKNPAALRDVVTDVDRWAFLGEGGELLGGDRAQLVMAR